MSHSIYNRIRLSVLKHKEPYRVYYQMLGFCPNNITLFQQACRHRSVSRLNHQSDNERLEFLGDAVLSAVISDIIFKTFDTRNEGFLSKTRSKIVKRDTLNHLAIKLGLDKIVEVSAFPQSHNNNTYGNALEALIGAIYLDQGYNRCREIVEERIILPHIDLKKIARQEVNFKSRFIEWCQHHHLPYEFEIDNETLDENKNPFFHARVFIGNTLLGEGGGYSKKEAQQNAAQKALRHIKQQKNFADTMRKMCIENPSLNTTPQVDYPATPQ